VRKELFFLSCVAFLQQFFMKNGAGEIVENEKGQRRR
jgi:hypothetical protein